MQSEINFGKKIRFVLLDRPPIDGFYEYMMVPITKIFFRIKCKSQSMFSNLIFKDTNFLKENINSGSFLLVSEERKKVTVKVQWK